MRNVSYHQWTWRGALIAFLVYDASHFLQSAAVTLPLQRAIYRNTSRHRAQTVPRNGTNRFLSVY